jgi:hypothetical protein
VVSSLTVLSLTHTHTHTQHTQHTHTQTPIISPIRTIELYQAESTLLDLMTLVTSDAEYKLILPNSMLNLTKLKRKKNTAVWLYELNYLNSHDTI